MRVWLDDERKEPSGWERAYTVDDLKAYLDGGRVTVVSLDHDLGENLETGYDFLKWFESRVYSGLIEEVPTFRIHSANPVGRMNMQRAISNIMRYFEGGKR